MAPSIGSHRPKITALCFVCVCFLISYMPLTQSVYIPTEELSLTLQHDVKLGHTVLQDIHKDCMEIFHIQKSPSLPSKEPFSVTKDRRLVVNSSLSGLVDDLFVIQRKPTQACVSKNDFVSQNNPIHIRISQRNETLQFIRQSYHGTLASDARDGTVVSGIRDLYACSFQFQRRCSKNLDYRIQGTRDFFLQTLYKDAQIQLQILAKASFHMSPEESFNFVIVAISEEGYTGHTSVTVLKDRVLRYRPRGHRNGFRTKREVPGQEILATSNVNETATGYLFSVHNDSYPTGTVYALKSSTLPNAFTVSSTGAVSVGQNFDLDYEYFRAEGLTPEVTLTIEVKDANGIVLRELVKPINIMDVNDEMPQFVNEPSPFLATVDANAPAGTVVYTATAADPDATAQLTLTANFGQGADALFTNAVDAIARTVTIRKKTGLSLQTNSEYSVALVVEDTAAENPATQRTTAEIKIKAGLRPPQFFQTSFTIRFQEANVVSQVIASSIQVLSFQQHPVTCSILDDQNQPTALFVAQPAPSSANGIRGCQIQVTRVMDYETAPRVFPLTLIAAESQTGLSSSVSLRVEVTDKNEYNPRFTISAYKNDSVLETAPKDTVLLTVEASDLDFNSELAFDVTDPHFKIVNVRQPTPQGPFFADVAIDRRLDFDRRNPPMYEFTVSATDNGTIQRTGNATVRVFMVNLNDELPVFEDNMEASVRADAPRDTTVSVVKATDADAGDALRYQLVSPSTMFAIDATSGQVTLTQPFPADQSAITQFEYVLAIRATDDGGCCTIVSVPPTLSSVGNLTIRVLTRNEIRPSFADCGNYNPQVAEGTVNKSVITVLAADGDPGINGQVTYSLRQTENPRFWINPKTGELFTYVALDRETMPPTIPVNVMATDGGGLQGVCSMLVVITDINDNPPVFDLPVYNFLILNTKDVNSGVEPVQARDPDVGNNSIVQYSLTSNPGDYFRIETFTGLIRVNKALPVNNTNQRISLTVEAKDLGNPSLSSSVYVNITLISDVSLLPPEWIGGDNCSATINESQPISQNILTVSAASRVPNNEDLSFNVISEQGDDVTFTLTPIDSDGAVQQAVLRVNDPLDFEITEKYDLTVRVVDAKESLSSRICTVNLLDVNDKSPYFLGLDPVTNWLGLDVTEGNYTNSVLVGFIQGRDDDKTYPNNEVKDYAINKQDSDIFSINATTGELRAKGVLDRETTPFYTIKVQAVDGAPSALRNDGQSNTGIVVVKIYLTDTNDNNPVFSQSSYTFDVGEDTIGNDVVARVTASDPDIADVLTYFLSSSSNENVPFSIQRETGAIKVTERLDFESGKTRYTFQVTVSDSLHTGTASVTINVIDVNDNPPIVSDASFTFPENDTKPVGPFYTVTATDLDFNGVATFFYALKFTKPSDENFFDVDRNTGTLFIKKPLDRDYPLGSDTFVFQVEVADDDSSVPGSTVLVNFATITIFVTDVNDNAPTILLEDQQLSVRENQPSGTTVGTIKAIDYDAGENATVTASIAGQVPEVVFTQDGMEIKTTATLDRENISQYFVTIAMVDGGVEPQSSTATLTITVLDENDNAPFFNTTYHFKIPETMEGGDVGRVTAIDLDSFLNAQLTYSLAEASAVYFKMAQDPSTNSGILTVFQPVDYDDVENPQRNFNLTVYAVDSNPGVDNENRANTSVYIEVTDYNDETPKFVEPEKTITVSEDKAPGPEFLVNFTAYDRDVDVEYSRFAYFIAQKSDPMGKFAINSRGQVTLTNYLDYETEPIQIVHILAIDNPHGAPQNTATATLTVKIIDVNDNFPEFAQPYAPAIQENQIQSNILLLTFSATDRDGDGNGEPYSFDLRCNDAKASTQCNKFSLTTKYGTPDLGEIRVSGEFDREFEPVVMLPFYMCDLRGLSNRNDQQQCGMRYLGVNILDENDNKHSEGYQNILVYNYKGLFGEIEIGKVNTNDPDVNDNDKSFDLQNQAVAGYYVAVNPSDGTVTLKNGVPEMSFEIKVTVRDQTGLSKTSTVRIEVVFITDDAVFNSGSVRIKGITPEEFLFRPKKAGSSTEFENSMYEKFRKKLAEKLYGTPNSGSKLENVQILSVMSVNDGIDVRFAAHGSPWYSSSRMDGIVSTDRQTFNGVLSDDGSIDMVPVDMCQFETCEGGCFNDLVVKDTPVLINTKGSSFVGVNTQVVGTCGCRAKDFTQAISCTPGYCYHGGKCVQDNWGVVSCTCPEGFDGPRCQQLRQSFDGTGYALYRQLEQCETSRTSIEVLTTKASSVILYNGPMSDHQAGDPKDFLLLELLNGAPSLRVNQGTGELLLTLQSSKINDGKWHRIDIIRDKKSIKMMVDNCINSQVTNGVEDRSSCEVSGMTPGENFYINVASLLQLGGRVTSPNYPENVSVQRFTGCMRNLRHNTELYDLSTGGQFPGSKDGCQLEDDSCDKDCGKGQCEVTSVSSGGEPQGTCRCDGGYRSSSTSSLCDTETTERHLQDSSFMEWQLRQTFKLILNAKMTTVSFHVRTRDVDGIIFSVKDDGSAFITLRAVSKKLQLSYNLGDGDNDLLLDPVEVSDGQWHKVTIQRFGKEFILMIDSGEGRYYTEAQGPVVNGKVEFNPSRVVAGASVSYTSGSPVFLGEDFQDSCLNDIRYDDGWFPMINDENDRSPAATLGQSINTDGQCDKNDCPPNICKEGEVCIPLWGTFECVCPEHYNKTLTGCTAFKYCSTSPCFGDAICEENVPPGDGERPFKCKCQPGWYGDICQCHASLNAGGDACLLAAPRDEPAIASGLIIGIVLGILVLIAAIIVIAFLLFRRGRPSEELLEEDIDDDLRENIMYYDEEGAGEEDMTRYDLSRLRKPDDGEHPTTWDAPDMRKQVNKPLGASGDRPDIGDFIDNRLNDADDDPNSPPFDTPFAFNVEGGGSDAGSLSSLNTSSSGDQDYDYLNEWGPKFAKLADMYNSNQYDEEDL